MLRVILPTLYAKNILNYSKFESNGFVPMVSRINLIQILINLFFEYIITFNKEFVKCFNTHREIVKDKWLIFILLLKRFLKIFNLELMKMKY